MQFWADIILNKLIHCLFYSLYLNFAVIGAQRNCRRLAKTGICCCQARTGIKIHTIKVFSSTILCYFPLGSQFIEDIAPQGQKRLLIPTRATVQSSKIG